KKVGAEVKVITIVTAGSIAGRRYGNAFVCRNADARELGNDPAVSQLIVQHYRIATAVVLTDTTETAPQRRDACRTQLRCDGGFVEDLIAFVDYLHILRRAHFAIRIGRRAVTSDARKRNAVKVE